ncbi:FadR/GntR family transcriptional regulator [Sinobaca sp. H24]|uniref:FadR/GntR family transcriptional regulator n=1 Tax=Sinobaca sp. H24 TaxID=2923376 RepID=UPI00207933E0|nr:FadR/GntR family transcriptional regulator [Sinobaca sp. H24]
MEVEKVPAVHISEHVAAELETQIQTGTFKAHEKLPSVRELCDLFETGRSAVRDAISTLKGKGLVYVKKGEGTFVSPFDAAKLFHSGALLPDQQAIQELFQVRKMLETEMVKEAASYRTPEQADAVVQAAEAMETTLGPDSWELDYAFHQSIAKAAGNTILVQLMEFLSSTTKKAMIDFHLYLAAEPASSQKIIDQHAAIARFVQEADPENARRAMVDHLSFVEEKMQESILWEDKERSV